MTDAKTAKEPEVTVLARSSLSSSTGAHQLTTLDSDNLKLAEMGYKPELRRALSLWSLIGIGFGLTNSWLGVSAGLIVGISSGGPMIIVYGIIILAAVSTFIGISLAELASAYPNSGGQYFWTTQLAPKRYAPFLAYLCGSLAWFGSVFTSASVTLAIASAIVGMYSLGSAEPGFVAPTWSIVVMYEVVNIVLVLFNCYNKTLPFTAQAALYISLGSFLVITIVVPACATPHFQSASFVFNEFSNGTGWKSSGIAFIVGLINPNWCFACLDCATHMAEEIRAPERKIPIAIMATVAIGFVTSFCYAVAMFFSIRNLEDVMQSTTGVPMMDIFYQVTNSKAGAICLEILIMFTAVGANVSCHTWQARLCWSFSRDNGIWGSRYWSKIHPVLGVPLYAHLMSSFWAGALGFLYLGSSTAFNAMVTACITFLMLSYCVPVVCLLLKGRSSIPHGPFWLGNVGLFANWVVLAWTVFAIVFFSLPFTMPVEPNNMNYASVVLVGLLAYAVIYWFARGKKRFMTSEQRAEEAQELVQVLSNPAVETESKHGMFEMK